MSEDVAAVVGTTTPTGDTNAGGNVGSQGTSFIETLPEDLRGNETLKGYDSAEKLARAHIETLGKIQSPPETADGYEIKIPEGKAVNAEFVKGFKAWAHEAGLSTAQASKLAEQYMSFEDAQIAAMAKAEETALAAVKIEWGDKFAENVAVAQKAVAEFCTPQEREAMDATGMGNNPIWVRMFHRIGLAMSEDRIKGGGTGSGGGEMKRTAGGVPELDFPSMRKKE